LLPADWGKPAGGSSRRFHEAAPAERATAADMDETRIDGRAAASEEHFVDILMF